MYYDFEAGNKSYKLKLNTRNTIELEKKLGCNPLGVFGDGSTLPTVSQMVTILWASLQQYNHGITVNDAYDIFDSYLENHVLTDFFAVIIEVYKVSGLMPNEVEAEKN
jgi:hypothetical protein